MLNRFFYSSAKTKRPIVYCKAASSGIVPPDVIPPSYVAIAPSTEVTKLVEKLGPFTKKFAEVPPSTDSKHDKVVEANAQVLWEFAKETYDQKLRGKVDGFKAETSVLFNQGAYFKKGTTVSYLLALKNCKTVFARGKYANFWDAIGIVVQSHRDKEQRVPAELALTQEEFSAVKANLVYIGEGYGYSAKTSQSASYIKNTNRAQKQEDAAEFDKWLKSKADPLVRIIRMNISDVPLSYAMKEIQDFESNPEDLALKKALISKLRALQKEAVNEYRDCKKKGTVMDFGDWLEKK